MLITTSVKAKRRAESSGSQDVTTQIAHHRRERLREARKFGRIVFLVVLGGICNHLHDRNPLQQRRELDQRDRNPARR